ncbi:hypothetical protein [Crassaminicella indica]|uniref:Lipoprotein n=1 Tax=Crassaminicella indica TaxID=2855394 RepID=A0ABX8RCB3_9CLOT|nr:hypothetical protein [Crassaminicella indica]QXM05365.1 hypothetical protein KVH43_08160 [Crassaminicella indica]
MKNYKRFIALGLMSAVMVTTAACGGEAVKDMASSMKVESMKTSKADSLGYTFSEVSEKPEILKEFTKMDADYAAYLKSNPFSVLFLDEKMNITDETDVYSLPEKEDSTALYLYIKNDKVINAKLDAFNGEINTEGYTYDTLFYDYSNNMEKQAKEKDFPYDLENNKDDAEKELKAKFEGKGIDELQDFLKVYTPLRKYARKDTDKTLESYMIISEIGYTASKTINVIVKDNKIEKLYIDESYRPDNDPIEMLKAVTEKK